MQHTLVITDNMCMYCYLLPSSSTKASINVNVNEKGTGIMVFKHQYLLGN